MYTRKSAPSMTRLDQFAIVKHPLTTESAKNSNVHKKVCSFDDSVGSVCNCE